MQTMYSAKCLNKQNTLRPYTPNIFACEFLLVSKNNDGFLHLCSPTYSVWMAGIQN